MPVAGSTLKKIVKILHTIKCSENEYSSVWWSDLASTWLREQVTHPVEILWANETTFLRKSGRTSALSWRVGQKFCLHEAHRCQVSSHDSTTLLVIQLSAAFLGVARQKFCSHDAHCVCSRQMVSSNITTREYVTCAKWEWFRVTEFTFYACCLSTGTTRVWCAGVRLLV